MKTLLRFAAALALCVPLCVGAAPKTRKAAAAPKANKPAAAPKANKPAAAPKARKVDARYMSAGTAAAQSGFAPARNSGGTLFYSGKSSLRLVPDKPYCIVNGIKVFQCFPTKRRPGGLQVSRLEIEKTFAPLSARKTGVYRHRVATITIDPGHGGRDRGAAGSRLIEKVATFMISRRVAELLRNCRYRVYLTRSDDSFVPLPERCRLQRRHKSDIFVSIHVNAAAKKDLRGIEVFALTPAGAPSTSGGEPSHKVHSGNLIDANNLLLAYSIQGALLRRTKAVDRGVKRARFAVLRDITAPGVLVEVGFLSNPNEEKLLLDPKYREQLARGIVEGIIIYHHSLRQR